MDKNLSEESFGRPPICSASRLAEFWSDSRLNLSCFPQFVGLSSRKVWLLVSQIRKINYQFETSMNKAANLYAAWKENTCGEVINPDKETFCWVTKGKILRLCLLSVYMSQMLVRQNCSFLFFLFRLTAALPFELTVTHKWAIALPGEDLYLFPQVVSLKPSHAKGPLSPNMLFCQEFSAE